MGDDWPSEWSASFVGAEKTCKVVTVLLWFLCGKLQEGVRWLRAFCDGGILVAWLSESLEDFHVIRITLSLQRRAGFCPSSP